ncbi:MAG: glycosyltransferase [Planctomycetota bacterium]
MIFVTVGSQMPFDRLVRCVDAWAGERGRDDVFAQIGATGWEPPHLRWTQRLDTSEFRHFLFEAEVVITHAGVGTILTALKFGKPVLVMPRSAELGETRNNHQFGTAHELAKSRRIAVAWDDLELASCLDHLDEVPVPERIPSHASLPLLSAVRRFIRPGATIPGAHEVPPAVPLHPERLQERKAA